MHRRARPVVAWAVALVTLAVTVPLLALVVRDHAADRPSRGRLARRRGAVVRALSFVALVPGRARRRRSRRRRAARPQSAAPARALFFGDSYFIGGGYTGEDNSMARLAGNRLGWVSEVNGGGGTGFVQTNYEYDLGNYLDQIAERGLRRRPAALGRDRGRQQRRRRAAGPASGATRARSCGSRSGPSRRPGSCSSGLSTPTPTTRT